MTITRRAGFVSLFLAGGAALVADACVSKGDTTISSNESSSEQMETTGTSGGTAATEAQQSLTFDEFMARLPNAVCDYYVMCGIVPEADRDSCPEEIYDDVERDYACNGARGVYSTMAESLQNCVGPVEKACSHTDDLDLFCPNLKYLEDECSQ